MDYQFATRCIYGNHEKREKELTGAISYPIYQTATYAHQEVGKSTGFDYSRLQNPTREQLEKVVASLEKGRDALAFSSGMAAITALMELFHPQCLHAALFLCRGSLYQACRGILSGGL